jgi:hypothetical protein
MEISAHDRRRLAVAALCDERSVRRVYFGETVGDLLRRRIIAAAVELGMPTPPTISTTVRCASASGVASDVSTGTDRKVEGPAPPPETKSRPGASFPAADVAIEEERAKKLFGVCDVDERHGLMNYGVCEACQPEEYARRHAQALEVQRENERKQQAEFAERNKPIAALADAIETRRDAREFRGLCAALRAGEATIFQIRLARRLTSPQQLKRHKRTR